MLVFAIFEEEGAGARAVQYYCTIRTTIIVLVYVRTLRTR